MSEWKKEVDENGQEWWLHEKLGNVLKSGDDSYFVLFPKVIKLGPFRTPEEAQKAIEENKEKLEEQIDMFNLGIVPKS